MPGLSQPAYYKDEFGKKHPLPPSGVKPEIISSIQVVRDAHIGKEDAITAERFVGNAKNKSMGNFVIGHLFVPDSHGGTTPVRPLTLGGTEKLRKERFSDVRWEDDIIEQDRQNMASVGADILAEEPASLTANPFMIVQSDPPRMFRATGVLVDMDGIIVFAFSGTCPELTPGSVIRLKQTNINDATTLIGVLADVVHDADGTVSLLIELPEEEDDPEA